VHGAHQRAVAAVGEGRDHETCGVALHAKASGS
jgi:hypothetical protein